MTVMKVQVWPDKIHLEALHALMEKCRQGEDVSNRFEQLLAEVANEGLKLGKEIGPFIDTDCD